MRAFTSPRSSPSSHGTSCCDCSSFSVDESESERDSEWYTGEGVAGVEKGVADGVEEASGVETKTLSTYIESDEWWWW